MRFAMLAAALVVTVCLLVPITADGSSHAPIPMSEKECLGIIGGECMHMNQNCMCKSDVCGTQGNPACGNYTFFCVNYGGTCYSLVTMSQFLCNNPTQTFPMGCTQTDKKQLCGTVYSTAPGPNGCPASCLNGNSQQCGAELYDCDMIH